MLAVKQLHCVLLHIIRSLSDNPENVSWSLNGLPPIFFRLSGEVWLVPSRPLVNPPEERLPGSSWPPKLPGKARHLPVE